MSLNYLFGPVSRAFAENDLRLVRQAGNCLTFNAEGDVDLRIAMGDSWADVCTRFPSGWSPDLIALCSPFSAVPGCLVSAPAVRVALVTDCRECWHAYRRLLPVFDVVFADPEIAETLRSAGFSQTRPTHLCGGYWSRTRPPSATPAATADRQSPRDIDVLCIEAPGARWASGRNEWMWPLARLARHWRVQIKPAAPPDAHRKLLARARIVVFEPNETPADSALDAAAAGALVCQPQGALGLPPCFRDRHECLCYQPEQLDSLVEHYLTHPQELQRLADAGRVQAQAFDFHSAWSDMVRQLQEDWPALCGRGNDHRTPPATDLLLARSLLALRAEHSEDHGLLADLDRVLASKPCGENGDLNRDRASLRIGLATLLGRSAQGKGHATAAAEVAAEHFRSVLDDDPKSVLAGLGLAESFYAAGQTLCAMEAARRTLEVLSSLTALDDRDAEALLFPGARSTLLVEWERAAWNNVGKPAEEARCKRDLVGWRLACLLAECTEELSFHYDAVMLRSDLAVSRGALGVALTRAGKLAEARPHLTAAVAGNPFDRAAARALFHTLSALGDTEARRRFVEDQRLLQRAAPGPVPPEAWFAEAPPGPGALASLIVVCSNQLDFTRGCLESILQHTRPPYELIVVDNGSTDDTPQYLDEIRHRPGPERVEIIRNETNPGHPPAVNQALALIRGSYVVFLDNDTVMTPQWLDGLIHISLQDWPRNGMVGPVTNGAPDVQAVRPGYGDLKDLDPFAVARRKEFAGRVLANSRLTSFCLLARRDVLERIGNWDERFHPGFFVDDDLSVRAREAGFRLVVALDVYVHHFGHRTHHGMGTDSRKQLLDNFERFKEKWGEEYAAGYHLPAPPKDSPNSPNEQPPDEVARRHGVPANDNGVDGSAASGSAASGNGRAPALITVAEPLLPGASLCMIVRNEERHLPDCLASVRDTFDDAVVVDTGSTDGTRQVAQRFGARVFDFPWVDSFAAARNECLRHARHKWILWLDADDRIDDENRGRLKQLLHALGEERDAYALKVRSALDATATAFRLLDQVRVFRNLPEIRWDYRIHEQILPAVNRAGGGVRWADVVIDHVGYQDAGARKSKLERNLRLLEMDFAERPKDAFTLFNFGWTLLDLGRTEEASTHLREALSQTSPTSSTLRKLYHLIAVAERGLSRADKALAICREALGKFPDDGELRFEEGMLLRDRKDLLGAEQSWLRLLDTPRGQYFASEELGLRGFRTRHFLAEVYRAQERLVEAEVQWRAALRERLDFEPAWMSLAELYLLQSRGPDLEYLLQELESGNIAAPKAGWLRARGQVQRKDYAAARRTLAAVLAQDPGAVGPRVLLSQVQIQEGREWGAAEQSLRDVLAIAPDHAETKHNLTILLRRLGRGAAVP
jgi:glycosyltransferase involved in cell wall biosynthesis